MNINYATDEILAAIDKFLPLEKGMRLTEDTFENFINDHDSGIIEDYTHGASKLVVFLKDANFVVKIPFTGYMFDSEDSNYCDNYYDFEGAEEDDYGECWDYCWTEVKMYQKALTAGVEKYLLETEKIGEINGFPIYVQERCVSFFNSSINTPTYNEIAISKKKLEDNNIYTRILSSVFCFYCYLNIINGEDTYESFGRFNNFAKEYLSDIHKGNIGFNVCGKPVILDYSGYYEAC